MQTLEINVPSPVMTYLMDFDKMITLAGYFWLIDGAEQKILVDAGGGEEWLISHGFPAKQLAMPEELLANVGLKLEDIDIVIATHLMGDHIEYARKYKNAKIIVQRKELDWALRTHPAQAGLYPKEFLEGLKFTTVDGDMEIVDGVRVMLTPGHTPGGQSVAIETEKGVAVITGFCCVQQNLEPPEEVRENSPIIIPGIHINTIELWDSVQRVMACADIPIALHDPKWGKLGKVPS